MSSSLSALVVVVGWAASDVVVPPAAPAPARSEASAPTPTTPTTPTPTPTTPSPDQAALDEAKRLLSVGPDTLATYDKVMSLLATVKQPSALVAVAKAHEAEAQLRIGDLETDKNKKLAIYEKGKTLAETAVALDPKCSDCWFWKGATQGRWGETRGVLESINIVKPVRQSFEKALQLDPNNVDALLALALVDQKVPGFMGGDKDRAEKRFKQVLAIQPRFTRAMLDWAEFLWADGRKDEAKKWAQKALDEKSPRDPAEKKNRDDKRAKRLLAEWND